MNEEKRDVLVCRIVWLAIFAWTCAVLCSAAYLMAEFDECLAAGVAGFLALAAVAVRTR